MRLLLIHSDYIEYEVKRDTPVAEDIEESFRKGRLEEALTAFIAVESIDEVNPAEVVEKATEEIASVAGQVNTKRVMIYPYAHLSNDLGSPDVAVQVLKDLRRSVEERGLEASRAPFGWYKSFKISCKGHPLSELSRTITPESEAEEEREEEESAALKAEKEIQSYWYVLPPGGDLTPVEEFDLAEHEGLRKFADYEISGSREVEQMPPHVELMRRLELVDYEEASDPGNLRYYPKGRLIKSLLERYVTDESVKAGAMEVETPIMYDREHPTLAKYLERFPARQYQIDADKRKLFLRFAACFGQFLMNHDMTISHRNLPLKMTELTRYSFRREQRGELVGLRRLRAFTMPDMHTLCEDMNQAMSEFKEQYRMSIDILEDIGISLDDYEVAIRFTRDFYEENEEFIKSLVDVVDKPVLIEMWDERFFYFVLKFEFNFVDALDKASALSTVQIDVENAERYDINYVTADNEERRPTILHFSPSGAIERCMYALLEKAYLEAEEGERPMFPVWLSPTQVRLITVADRHIDHANQIADRLEERGIRVDVDDRDETVGKKIRGAGREWVPYVAVIGDREIEDDSLSVNVRASGEKLDVTPEELGDMVASDVRGMPKKPLPLPRLLSRRPSFQ